jgi:hypothetical protein
MSAVFPGFGKILSMEQKEESRPREEPRINREVISVVSLGEEDGDREYWLSRTPQERVEHVEFLRRLNYGSRATGRLQRVFEVVER